MQQTRDRRPLAVSLMDRFAEGTGLTGDQPPRRYLWTDAHAVCNFLSLQAGTGGNRFRTLALRLVDQVHEILGRYRPGDPRSGWLSGLDDARARQHPTAGGLRIGKPLPERGPREPFDPAAEWARDGQYYHYLTKWMHALMKVAQATGEARYLDWAAELAGVAHERFRATHGPPRLYWKMSVDLSRPMLPSSGQHDPLDGLVTAMSLRTGDRANDPALTAAIHDLARICRNGTWETDDPLGIGGLLFDAGRLVQLGDAALEVFPASALTALLQAAARGLASFRRDRTLGLPARERLAFRELGLAIGLHAIETAGARAGRHVSTALEALTAERDLADRIEGFWADPLARTTDTWLDHQDINAVMLATSLAPQRFIEI